jgi:S-formylglutathione hydrolase
MKFSLHRPKDIKNIKGALIWLSGLTCNEENFITKAGIQKILKDTGLAVFCPDTSPRGLNLPQEHDSYDFGSGASLYVDATTPGYKDHYRMYSYIQSEFFNLMNETFNLNSNISIFGHSMGGHGALTIGLRNPEQFKSVSAFAPMVNPMLGGWGQRAFEGYLGSDEKSWRAYDTCALLEDGFKHPQELLIDQGSADEFLKKQLLLDHLQKAADHAGQKLNIQMREGYDHSYYFISSFLQSHIDFHKQHLLNTRK